MWEHWRWNFLNVGGARGSLNSFLSMQRHRVNYERASAASERVLSCLRQKSEYARPGPTRPDPTRPHHALQTLITQEPHAASTSGLLC